MLVSSRAASQDGADRGLADAGVGAGEALRAGNLAGAGFAVLCDRVASRRLAAWEALGAHALWTGRALAWRGTAVLPWTRQALSILARGALHCRPLPLVGPQVLNQNLHGVMWPTLECKVNHFANDASIVTASHAEEEIAQE